MEYLKGSEPFSWEGKGDTGILISHGFTSTPDSFRYVGKKLHEAGFHVECPRLDGHGTRWQDLNQVAYTDWLANLEEALTTLQKRASRIFMMGLSLGGTLTLRMAQLHPEFKGIIIINHLLFFGNPLIFLVPVLRYILPATKPVANDIKDKSQTELAYDKLPSNGVYEMTRLTKLVKRDLSQIKMPVLMFKSRNDHVLPRKNEIYTFEKIGSEKKELVWLDNSFHVVPMDYDKDLMISRTVDFIGSIK